MCRADHWYRGVLLTVVCLSVIVKLNGGCRATRNKRIFSKDEFFALRPTPNQKDSPLSAFLEGLYCILTAAFCVLTSCSEFGTSGRAMTCQGH